MFGVSLNAHDGVSTRSVAERSAGLTGEQVHPVHIQVVGQLLFGGGAVVAAKVLGDAHVVEPYRLHDLEELCLRQSTAYSSRP